MIDLKEDKLRKIRSRNFEKTDWRPVWVSGIVGILVGIGAGSYTYYKRISEKPEVISLAKLRYVKNEKLTIDNKNEENISKEVTESNLRNKIENKSTEYVKDQYLKNHKEIYNETKTDLKTKRIRILKEDKAKKEKKKSKQANVKLYRVIVTTVDERERAIEIVKNIKARYPMLDPFVEATDKGYRVIAGTYAKIYHVNLAKEAAKSLGYTPTVTEVYSKGRAGKD